MATRHRPELSPNAVRIANWLVDKRAEFEERGISEDATIDAAGVEKAEARTAIDQLENRETLVRDPEALTKPPRFVLKPGRNWPDMRDRLLGSRSASVSG